MKSVFEILVCVFRIFDETQVQYSNRKETEIKVETKERINE